MAAAAASAATVSDDAKALSPTALERFLERVGKVGLTDKICEMASQVWKEYKNMIIGTLGYESRVGTRIPDNGVLTAKQMHAVRILAGEMAQGTVCVTNLPLGLDPKDGTTTLVVVLAWALTKLDPALKIAVFRRPDEVEMFSDGGRQVIFSPPWSWSGCEFDVLLIDLRPNFSAPTTTLVHIEQAIHRNQAWCLQFPGEFVIWPTSVLDHFCSEGFMNKLWLLRELRRNPHAVSPDEARWALWRMVGQPHPGFMQLVYVSLLLSRVKTAELMVPHPDHPTGHRTKWLPCTLLHGIIAVCIREMFSRPWADRGIPTVVQSLVKHYLPDSNGLMLNAPCAMCGTKAPPLNHHVLKELPLATVSIYIEDQRKKAEEALINALPVQALRNIVYVFLKYPIE
jgi:hypothetical protein